MGVAGLLLAAGAGRRMGMPKALVIGADGRPWAVSAARVLAAGGCDEVVVVVGAEADAVRTALAGEPVTVVEAPDWADGMSASLRAGLDALASSDVAACLVHLVDLPDVPASVVRRVADVGASASQPVRASYGGRPGHPVLLPRTHWAPLRETLAGDEGAAAYLGTTDVTLVECSDLAGGHDVDRHRS